SCRQTDEFISGVAHATHVIQLSSRWPMPSWDAENDQYSSRSSSKATDLVISRWQGEAKFVRNSHIVAFETSTRAGREALCASALNWILQSARRGGRF